jgi:hypothetical protein
VDDLAILLKQVDLLNAGNLVDTQALDSGLNLLVIGGSVLVDSLVRPPYGALATNAYLLLQLKRGVRLIIDETKNGRPWPASERPFCFSL